MYNCSMSKLNYRFFFVIYLTNILIYSMEKNIFTSAISSYSSAGNEELETLQQKVVYLEKELNKSKQEATFYQTKYNEEVSAYNKKMKEIAVFNKKYEDIKTENKKMKKDNENLLSQSVMLKNEKDTLERLYHTTTINIEKEEPSQDFTIKFEETEENIREDYKQELNILKEELNETKHNLEMQQKEYSQLSLIKTSQEDELKAIKGILTTTEQKLQSDTVLLKEQELQMEELKNQYILKDNEKNKIIIEKNHEIEKIINDSKVRINEIEKRYEENAKITTEKLKKEEEISKEHAKIIDIERNNYNMLNKETEILKKKLKEQEANELEYKRQFDALQKEKVQIKNKYVELQNFNEDLEKQSNRKIQIYTQEMLKLQKELEQAKKEQTQIKEEYTALKNVNQELDQFAQKEKKERLESIAKCMSVEQEKQLIHAKYKKENLELTKKIDEYQRIANLEKANYNALNKRCDKSTEKLKQELQQQATEYKNLEIESLRLKEKINMLNQEREKYITETHIKHQALQEENNRLYEILGAPENEALIETFKKDCKKELEQRNAHQVREGLQHDYNWQKETIKLLSKHICTLSLEIMNSEKIETIEKLKQELKLKITTIENLEEQLELLKQDKQQLVKNTNNASEIYYSIISFDEKEKLKETSEPLQEIEELKKELQQKLAYLNLNSNRSSQNLDKEFGKMYIKEKIEEFKKLLYTDINKTSIQAYYREIQENMSKISEIFMTITSGAERYEDKQSLILKYILEMESKFLDLSKRYDTLVRKECNNFWKEIEENDLIERLQSKIPDVIRQIEQNMIFVKAYKEYFEFIFSYLSDIKQFISEDQKKQEEEKNKKPSSFIMLGASQIHMDKTLKNIKELENALLQISFFNNLIENKIGKIQRSFRELYNTKEEEKFGNKEIEFTNKTSNTKKY